MNNRRFLSTPPALFAALFSLSVLGATSAFSGDRTENVHFSAGASAATVSGGIRGYDGVNYMLGANAGQTIHILFDPDNNACYFNFFAPGSEEALFNGSTSGNEFSIRLSASGQQRAQVYLMRNAARRNETCTYSISFEITG